MSFSNLIVEYCVKHDSMTLQFDKEAFVYFRLCFCIDYFGRVDLVLTRRTQPKLALTG